MHLHHNANTTIKEIKSRFTKYFPYLKLEFFGTPHGTVAASVPVSKIRDSHSLIEISGILKEGPFEFDPAMTVADFEQRMQKEYGLPVQIFRKSGAVWIETIQTDHLSLEKQNLMGRDASRPIKINPYTLFL